MAKINMNLDEMLREVFSECYENVSDEKKAYKRANENFHKLLKDYELDNEKSLKRFKSNNGWGDYNFREKHVQLLKFIKELDKKNPIYRKNVPDEMLFLENFYIAAKKVEEIIEEDKYPEITDVLEDSLRTREFLSLYSIRDLVVKVVQLFQYACESEYTDFTIYNQVNKYLDTLLYTYAGTENFKSIMKTEQGEIPNIRFIYAQEYDGKLEFKPISTYNGFNSYIKTIFETVTNSKCDSISINIVGDNKFKFDYIYEFKDIEQLTDFLNIYYEYYCQSDCFREKFFPTLKNSFFKIADCVITLKPNQFKILKGTDEDFKPIFDENYVNMFSETLDEVSEDLHNISNDNDGEFTELMNKLVDIQDILMCYYSMTFGNGKLIRFFWYLKNLLETLISNHEECFEKLVLNVCYCIFRDFILYNVICEENGEIKEKTIPFQISYKNYPLNLSDFSDLRRAKGLSKEEFVGTIIRIMQDTEKQVENDLKCDDVLFSNVDNAVGIYLSELFEKDKNNKSKKKQN
ncbi:MAG: hypothetical protein NC253_14765 [Ruminococcus sp.]|nr:hypothetical protein [Ruminococcus sp.]